MDWNIDIGSINYSYIYRSNRQICSVILYLLQLIKSFLGYLILSLVRSVFCSHVNSLDKSSLCDNILIVITLMIWIYKVLFKITKTALQS